MANAFLVLSRSKTTFNAKKAGYRLAVNKTTALDPSAIPIGQFQVDGLERLGYLLVSVGDTLLCLAAEDRKSPAVVIQLREVADVGISIADRRRRMSIVTRDGSRQTLVGSAQIFALGRLLGDRGASVTGLELVEPPAPPTPVMVVTTDHLVGHDIIEMFGIVYGSTVRSRNFLASLGADFAAMAGGELEAFSKMVLETRKQAMHRLEAAARARGANAVVQARFDTESMAKTGSQATCVVAYGTAVLVVPRDLPVDGPGRVGLEKLPA